MDAVEQFKYKKLRISIFPDEDSQNPYKEWDNLSDTNFWLRGAIFPVMPSGVEHVYVTKKKAAQEFPRYRGRMLWLACERVARSEIQTLGMYLTNQVYGYGVSTKKGKELDSCWGCYGLDYSIQAAKASADYPAQSRAAIKAQKKLVPFAEELALTEASHALL